jgi:patatin-like phospholipase/acyl hydrolase
MQKINVLSIDGGGILGVTVITQLVEFEKSTKTRVQDHFQFFTGTSTGAIIASLLAIGVTPKEILDLYVIHGPKIFKKSAFRWGLFRAKYNDNYLNQVLAQYYGSVKIKDINMGKHLLIPTFDITTNKLVCYASYKQDPSSSTKLVDIVRASASAQTYFKPHVIDGNYYIDGGNVLNNPAEEAYLDCLDILKYEKINILSFSTGDKENPLSDKQARGGIAQLAKLTVKTILSEQAQRVDQSLERRYDTQLEIGVYKRIDAFLVRSSDKIDLATDVNIKNLILDGKQSAEYNAPFFVDFVNHTR